MTVSQGGFVYGRYDTAAAALAQAHAASDAHAAVLRRVQATGTTGHATGVQAQDGGGGSVVSFVDLMKARSVLSTANPNSGTASNSGSAAPSSTGATYHGGSVTDTASVAGSVTGSNEMGGSTHESFDVNAASAPPDFSNASTPRGAHGGGTRATDANANANATGAGAGAGGAAGSNARRRAGGGRSRSRDHRVTDPTAVTIAHALEKLQPGGAQVLSEREGAVAAKYIAELHVQISKLHDMNAKGNAVVQRQQKQMLTLTGALQSMNILPQGGDAPSNTTRDADADADADADPDADGGAHNEDGAPATGETPAAPASPKAAGSPKESVEDEPLDPERLRRKAAVLQHRLNEQARTTVAATESLLSVLAQGGGIDALAHFDTTLHEVGLGPIMLPDEQAEQKLRVVSDAHALLKRNVNVALASPTDLEVWEEAKVGLVTASASEAR